MVTGCDTITGLRSLIECPICLELDGVPKVLPCQHTMCQECVGSLRRIGPNTVTCPICRKQTGISPAGTGDLPTNLTIVQLRDMMDTVQKQCKKKVCECCGEPGQTVSHVCKDCEEQFCDKCTRKHPSRKLFTDHKPVPITSMVVCSDHKRPFTFFCLDCNKLLCLVCHSQEVCDGHQVGKVGHLKAEKEAAMKEIIKKIVGNIEANRSKIQEAKVAVTEGLECVKHIKQEIEEQGKKLKDQIDVQVKILFKEVDTYEHSLHAIKEQVESDNQLVTLSKLKETAEAACNGGIEQTLLTLPTIQAALPPNPKPVSQQAFTKLMFTPQDSINVGVLNKTEITLHTTNIKSLKVWEKANVGEHVFDVVHLRKGKIVFTEKEDRNNIILMDREGKVLAESTQEGVRLQDPRGIAYHPTQGCLLVCDCKGGHVSFLHPTTLCEMTKVKIPGIHIPTGVCVMSDGNIVVSGEDKVGELYSDFVGVFDIHGSQLHLWHTYNNGAHKFAGAWYIAVDDEDNILVSNYSSKKIVKLDKMCRFLCEWSTRGEPWGLAVAGDIVLVAERSPDCVRAYNLQGGDARQVLAWDRGKGHFGKIRSLSIVNNDLTVVGARGLQMYKLTTR